MKGGESTDGVPLTPEERELLARALDEGYFEIPRQTSLPTLAEEVGISDQEAVERLTSAMAKVLRRSGEFRHDGKFRLGDDSD